MLLPVWLHSTKPEYTILGLKPSVIYTILTLGEKGSETGSFLCSCSNFIANHRPHFCCYWAGLLQLHAHWIYFSSGFLAHAKLKKSSPHAEEQIQLIEHYTASFRDKCSEHNFGRAKLNHGRYLTSPDNLLGIGMHSGSQNLSTSPVKMSVGVDRIKISLSF